MTFTAARTHRHVEHCMGTVFSIDVRAPGVPREVVEQVVAWLHHVDATYSTYRRDSVISKLADGRLHRDEVDDEVRGVLDRCDELHRLTGGAFSAYAGGVLDPSGYVKGWAIERASDLLAAAGSLNHCVNGGGDVQCRGRASADCAWTVGIADPARPGRLISRANGEGSFAVATSGNAERGAHIVDPRTGLAADTVASVTVLGTNLADVDALATAAFVLGHSARTFLAGTGLRAVIADLDGTVHTV